jgi:hypothetical protein
VDRVAFSADYPYETIEEAAAWFDSSLPSCNDAQKIGRERPYALREPHMIDGLMCNARHVDRDAEGNPASAESCIRMPAAGWFFLDPDRGRSEADLLAAVRAKTEPPGTGARCR